MLRSRPLFMTLLLAAALAFAGAPAAQAAYTFVAQERDAVGIFEDPPGALGNLTVTPGATVVVELFLLADGSEATQLDSEQGLISAGVALARVQATGVGTLADPDVLGNPAFDDDLFTTVMADLNGGADLDLFLDTAAASTGVGPHPVNADEAVYLGEVTLHAPLTPGVTTFLVQDNDPQSIGTLTWGTSGLDGIPLDASINPSTFTVTVIPEPATLGLLALGGTALVARRRRW
jgi:hypothetical protein